MFTETVRSVDVYWSYQSPSLAGWGNFPRGLLILTQTGPAWADLQMRKQTPNNLVTCVFSCLCVWVCFCQGLSSQDIKSQRMWLKIKVWENKKDERRSERLRSLERSLQRVTEGRFWKNRRVSVRKRKKKNKKLPTYSSRAISMTPLHFLKPWEMSADSHTHTDNYVELTVWSHTGANHGWPCNMTAFFNSSFSALASMTDWKPRLCNNKKKKNPGITFP